MELGDWLVIVLIICTILVVSGYLQKHNPQTYSVVDSMWSRVSTGAYDLVSGFVSQMKTPPKTAINITGVTTNG